ncbi:MAG: hypothetical protein ABJG47_18040 [Ekhidna sp.]
MRKIIYTLLTISYLTTSAQGLREIYQEGIKAYEDKNYELFKEKMLTIDTLRPNYPAVVYNLASSYALTDQKELSLKVLEKYILMDATQDFTKDEDFNAILELPGFIQIQKKQKELTKKIEVKKAYEYPVLSAHPEAIAYSENKDMFFIGGVKDGNIWKVEEGKEPEIWAESPKKSWSVMGLEVSKDNEFLWACTSVMSFFEDYDQNEDGFASVLKYNLKNGELLETFALPGGHNFGDLISDDNGNIYISDGSANKIYWVQSKVNKLEVYLDLSNTVFNLQGLSLSKDQQSLYLSDYIDGIYKINLATKEAIKLKVEANEILLKGIDGLYYDNGTLIGLHNGTNPNRIVRYQLSENESSIVSKEVLAQGGTLGEPTQGVWRAKKFYFIVNSPWGSYDGDGNFNPEGQMLKIGVIE